MSAADMEYTINDAWETPGNINPRTEGAVRKAVLLAMKMLDSGKMRVAEQATTGEWHVNEWLKKAILMYFKMHREQEIKGGPDGTVWWDKVPSKFQGWDYRHYSDAKFRSVPGSIVRYSAFVGKNAVLMPSFINVGARVDEGTMIDTWATVGSCAQVGKNCHISGGVGIGGVLEPLQAAPVIIEDNVFIGARSEIAEGVHIEKGAVISMGVFIGASTKVIDRNSGEIFQGKVPSYAVVVPGTLPGKALPDGSPGPNLACAVIVKRADEQTRSKTSINELLRA
ncbi:MAG: 2,3,4,5-tetrahydropyridine-2,6-dicarboxylate N-succinyltransferase [Rhodospirillales bacterium]|nr:2,3,4,5-tetrahydropyridine-2,6-dicarboxylate N-succinyltransferase [Rhodospirillales bacterium]MCB9997262.1 2,3,4,5-tetrahydropyridine-2,6-dicarboxylate N-succinyltransferase [Rhodospirillales bacterium]